ncbi:MAG: hypothetical protein ACM3PU_14080, partial [Gemmatimonadota bacterium]
MNSMHRDMPSRSGGAAMVGLILKVLLIIAATFAFAAFSAPAESQTLSSKIAPDLQQVISAPTTPSLSWVKDVNGVRMVKALVVSSSTDPDLADLRSAVLSAGGSVYYRFASVRAITVMLPANQVNNLAARSDVQSISPDRLVGRTMSNLEYVTGTLNAGVRTYTSSTAYTGLDGTGIGIAILDSGIERW